jgi:hypothetical protein
LASATTATTATAPALAIGLVSAPAAPAKLPVIPAVNLNLVKMGYSAYLKGDQYFYCRLEDQTGSRLKLRSCRTEDELARIDIATREYLDSIHRASETHPTVLTPRR